MCSGLNDSTYYITQQKKKLQLEVGGGAGEGKGKEKGNNKNSLINPVSAKRNEARRKHHQQKERNCNKKPWYMWDINKKL